VRQRFGVEYTLAGLDVLLHRTWGRRGCTPVVRVAAVRGPRVSVAALVAARLVLCGPPVGV